MIMVLILCSLRNPSLGSIRVAFNRLRYCPVELCKESSLPSQVGPVPEAGASTATLEEPILPSPDPPNPRARQSLTDQFQVTNKYPSTSHSADIWSGRLRSRKKPVEDTSDKDGDM